MTYAATSMRVQLDDVQSPQFVLKRVTARVTFDQPSAFAMNIDEMRIGERVWRNATLTCPRATIETDLIACEQGTLDVGMRLPLALRYLPRARQMQLRIEPDKGEIWRADLSWGREWQADLSVRQGALARLSGLLGDAPLALSAGHADVRAHVAGDARGATRVDAAVSMTDAAFSDHEGTHAGERVRGSITLHATKSDIWRWQTEIAQQAGEVFWAPFYFPSTVRHVTATGTLGNDALTVQTGKAVLSDMGTMRFAGQWQPSARRLKALDVQGEQLAFDGIYRTLLKPLLGESVWARFQVSGRLDGRVLMREGLLREVSMNIQDARLQHERGILALDGVQAEIPWRREGGTQARMQVAGGNVRGVALGPFEAQAMLDNGRVQVRPLHVPVLDGALAIDELQFERGAAGKWQWQLAGALRPVSMAQLASALHWPAMQGTLSGVIPRITYVDRNLSMEGALLARVFDGNVVVKHVSATDPLGVASHVRADIDLTRVDLEQLTRQFSFGSITGRLDGRVAGLELSGWQPVAFDAQFMSSPGEYPRRISQRAVESISALGGGSAAAAIQRTFLRFFDQFGYQRLGWGCRLAHDVCEMDGIEDLAQGYLIVKGGGIPALSVIGYNRRVGWNDLVERLRYATRRGVRPVVQ